jgi:hypothetical protein
MSYQYEDSFFCRQNQSLRKINLGEKEKNMSPEWFTAKYLEGLTNVGGFMLLHWHRKPGCLIHIIPA